MKAPLQTDSYTRKTLPGDNLCVYIYICLFIYRERERARERERERETCPAPAMIARNSCFALACLPAQRITDRVDADSQAPS